MDLTTDSPLAVDAPVDRLASLLQRFPISARMFHSGALCGVTDFAENGFGQLHLVRRGPLEVRHTGCVIHIAEPTLLFYPRPLNHRFVSDSVVGAELACANVAFSGGARGDHHLARALPAFVALPLRELPGAGAVLELLFDEAFAQRCGRQRLIDNLFEVVIVLLLRELIDSGRTQSGLIAGLGHPRLRKTLIAIHDCPARGWTLELMAHTAGMSRSRFTETFARIVGEPPAGYLTAFRIALAQQFLRTAEPLDSIAAAVGYGSAAALSRTFSKLTGESPRAWQRSAAAGK